MSHQITDQEKFIIDILDHKQNGYYVELGAFHSSDGSNTYVLEKDYNWSGVSFEINDSARSEFNVNRSNPCMGDALQFNYISYFEENNFPKQIDFLQIDIDAGYNEHTGFPEGDRFSTLKGLLAVPLNQYRFSIITFEHDASMYWRNTAIKDFQREILDSFGYVLLVQHPHEDWWVDPKSIPATKFKKYYGWK